MPQVKKLVNKLNQTSLYSQTPAQRHVMQTNDAEYEQGKLETAKATANGLTTSS